MQYLQPPVNLLHVQVVAGDRSRPGQRHLVGGAPLHVAQRRDTGDDVGVAKEAEGDQLALARWQHTPQWQDIENLEGREERSRC